MLALRWSRSLPVYYSVRKISKRAFPPSCRREKQNTGAGEHLEEAYIVDYLRSPFSRSRPSQPEKDVFNSLRMDEVLAKLIRKIVERSGIRPKEIGDVITGCALQVDENWTYGGRQPTLLAGLPVEVPAFSLDRACSSSLNAIAIGAMEISQGYSDIVLAGGYEHMTHVPMSDNQHIAPNLKLLLRPEYMKYQMNIGYSMGLTAEKLAEESGIGREEMDRFSLRSHKLASEALEEGWLREEILPVETEHEGSTIIVDRDQCIRTDADIEKMRSLGPVFKQGGVITAGNSAPLNAGASIVMLMSGRKIKEYGLHPISKITSMGWAGVEPSVMGKGPVPASSKVLRTTGLSAGDIDLWEINEAFAVVALYAIRELGLEENRVNVRGGSIAIGHPLGASGARLAGTLSRLLRERGKEKGIATLCVGGGQGFSMLLERV
ncbi:MAG: acetyl-CoA C-acetyltransferase [Thermoplasmata archaeon]|uniref:acetyl-CoA C-acyltransferase n=1 Tax=Candidatus Sysuiplasma superficiale TaxID=2823368 RepID=A0A8J8CIN4_9ARCH|nr:acetyl-CoA C-acetyltransferase [Candidatus Sysuiplasma superficiale]